MQTIAAESDVPDVTEWLEMVVDEDPIDIEVDFDPGD